MLIAHFSDIHVAPEGKSALHGINTRSTLAHCVEHINNLDPQPDVILITGDLTSEGSPDEYAVLRSYLSLLDQPYFLIPGNHDNRKNLRAAFSDFPHIGGSGDFINYTVEDYSVRLIGLDTLLPGSESGILCDQRLNWLDKVLVKSPDRQTLLFMHHPPFMSGLPKMDKMRLKDSKKFADVLQKHSQIEMILCGHLHRPVQTIWENIPTLVATSISKQFPLNLGGEEMEAIIPEPTGLYLHLLTEEGLVTHTSLLPSSR
tara:strand:- start:1456 stop:2232 length:777 start_codon:yes stop_codon:yes gene_type:complete